MIIINTMYFKFKQLILTGSLEPVDLHTFSPYL